jgi:flavin reductase (DIM6/NTAB) family NADH-FMN oxidoreductase RutF
MSSEGGPASETPVTSEEFRRACGRFATGITIASVLDANGTPHGLTVNSFTSVSLDPPLILICLGHAVTTIDAFRQARHFGINVLAEDQQALSDRFARKGHDRFDGLAWYRGESGVPLLHGVLATIECRLHQRFTSGDHDIFVGEMVGVHSGEGEPLLYYASRYRRLALD